MFNKKLFVLSGIGLTIALTLLSCKSEPPENTDESAGEISLKDTITQLDRIQSRKKIRVLTDYNSTNYFIFRGTPMGFHYERAEQFANELGVSLEIIPENNIDTAFAMLNRNQCDILAMDLAVTRKRKELVNFAQPHYHTRQMLVQQKPTGWRKMATYDEVEKHLVRSPLQLARDTVHVQEKTAYVNRLHNLMEEIGDTIYISEDSLEVEQLIKKVADGKIRYTIADEHVANVNTRYFPDIDVKTPISFPQNVAWAVKKGHDSLLQVINEWQQSFNDTFLANVLYNKYFKNSGSQQLYYSEYHSITGSRISAFDHILKEEAKKLGWDWRLIASMIYQESNFLPDAQSWMGAYGLMQMMPATMQKMGIDSSASP
ncbi:MAG TPA: transporter substrate-binding domain-containing protein, partial [Bacteroidales bacterium]|nr:transporter substrate-binding domain-containing protein [Bacteroidales bacterium]